MPSDRSGSTLEELLATVESLPWNHSLYLSADDTTWSLGSRALVWDQDDVDDGEATPAVPASLGLKSVLSISTVQDIVSNRKQQGDWALEDLYVAVLYYYRNDAFIRVP